MDRVAIKKFLACIGAERVGDRGEWVVCSCPLAPWTHTHGKDSKPSFAVKVLPGRVSYYNCYSCGGGTTLHDLIIRLREEGAIPSPKINTASALDLLVEETSGDLSLDIKGYDDAPEEVSYFPEEWLAFFPPVAEVPAAMGYLSERQITDAVIKQLDLRWDPKQKAIVFPHRDFAGDLIGARSRLLDPVQTKHGKMKYYVYKNAVGKHNSQHWYGEEWVDFSQTMVIVESVFDVASVLRVYPSVVAPLYASFSQQKAKRLQDAQKIVTVMDSGMGGDVCRSKVEKYLSGAEQHHVYLGDGQDPGSLTEQEVSDLVLPLVGSTLNLQFKEWG